MNTKIIKLDINNKMYETITAKQGDTKSRFLLFNLLDGSIPFSLENRSVRVYAVKPDRTEVFNDLIITDAAKGYCILELTTQMLAVAGTVRLELMVIEEDKKLTSNIFYMDVKESINSEKAVVSTNEFTALMNGLAALSEYDIYKSNAKQVPGIKEEVSNLSSQLDKTVRKGEGGSVTWAMASQDFRENVTGGNTAVVGKDSVLKENIVDGEVIKSKATKRQEVK